MAQQVLAHDEDDHAGRGDVLLRAGVDHAEFGDVVDLGEDVGGHIRHQRDVAGVRHMVIARAVDGVVCGDVDVPGVRGECVVRDVGVVVLAGGAGDVDLAVLLGLHQRVVREVAGVDVVSLAALHQVQGHGGEHGGRAALQEHDLVALRHAHHVLKVRDGLLEDLQVHFRSVTHLHDGHARTAVAEQVLLYLFEHFSRKHGRAGREIVDAIHRNKPPQQIPPKVQDNSLNSSFRRGYLHHITIKTKEMQCQSDKYMFFLTNGPDAGKHLTQAPDHGMIFLIRSGRIRPLGKRHD